MLRRLLEPKLRAVIAVDHDTFGLSVLDRHPERVDDQVRCLRRVDRPANDPTRERVEHDRAVHLAFPCPMFCYVGQPQPVRLRAGEVAVDEVGRCRCVRGLPIPGPAWQASDVEPTHHQLDPAPGDGHLPAEDELGMHTSGAVGLA